MSTGVGAHLVEGGRSMGQALASTPQSKQVLNSYWMNKDGERGHWHLKVHMYKTGPDSTFHFSLGKNLGVIP